MKIFKIILGACLLSVAALLSVATLVTIPLQFINGIARINEEGSIGFANLLGTLLGVAILATVIYFLFRFGLKLIRKKPAADLTIDEIGTEA